MVHRFDAQNQHTVLIDANRTAGLADNNRDGFGALGDCGGCPVPRTETFGELEILVEDFDDLPRSLCDSIGRNNERAVHLRNLFDVFADTCVMQIAVLATVAFQGIEATVLAVGHDLARIADDEEGTDFLPFAPFSTDLHGEIDHGFEVIEGNGGFESLQVAAGEPSHPFIEFDDRNRIDAGCFEAAVDGYDIAGTGQQFVGDCFEERVLQPFEERGVFLVEDQRKKAETGGRLEILLPIGGYQNPLDIGRDQLPEPLPIGRSVEQEQDRVGLNGYGEIAGGLDDTCEFPGNFLSAHGSAGLAVNSQVIVDSTFKHAPIRSLLVGGGSSNPNEEWQHPTNLTLIPSTLSIYFFPLENPGIVLKVRFVFECGGFGHV